jgi:DNA-binding response OmpR family regulator
MSSSFSVYCRSVNSERLNLSTIAVEPVSYCTSSVMKRILVIDDDPCLGEAIQTILARHGYEAVLALRAHAGINAFELSEFDAVMVDLFLPGMSGLDTILRIRNLAPKVPIIAMSGFRFQDSMGPGQDFFGMAAQSGATSSVRKPFTPWQLMAAINSGLGLVSSTIALLR